MATVTVAMRRLVANRIPTALVGMPLDLLTLLSCHSFKFGCHWLCPLVSTQVRSNRSNRRSPKQNDPLNTEYPTNSLAKARRRKEYDNRTFAPLRLCEMNRWVFHWDNFFTGMPLIFSCVDTNGLCQCCGCIVNRGNALAEPVARISKSKC